MKGSVNFPDFCFSYSTCTNTYLQPKWRLTTKPLFVFFFHVKLRKHHMKLGPSYLRLPTKVSVVSHARYRGHTTQTGHWVVTKYAWVMTGTYGASLFLFLSLMDVAWRVALGACAVKLRLVSTNNILVSLYVSPHRQFQRNRSRFSNRNFHTFLFSKTLFNQTSPFRKNKFTFSFV